eukprot:scaffold25486_cov161-Isochrysis_galbana.AAC.3
MLADDAQTGTWGSLLALDGHRDRAWGWLLRPELGHHHVQHAVLVRGLHLVGVNRHLRQLDALLNAAMPLNAVLAALALALDTENAAVKRHL